MVACLSGLFAITLAFAAAPAPASASTTASCTSYSTFYVAGNPADGFFYMPTIGTGTRNANCLLGVSNQGDAVLVLQEDLDFCYGYGLKLDSIFGPLTRDAVIRAQKAGGVAQDGIYGPVTANHMWWGGPGTGAFCYLDGGIPV